MPTALDDSTRAPSSSFSSRETGAIEVRPLRTHEDYLACVEMQREIWGQDFNECVPPSILKVVPRIGGIAAGAFDTGGRLLGFVFGLSGVENGKLVHWSDMLAVRAEARNLGLGRRLKEYQRETLLELGVEVVYWTFDPLVARNAHLNLNRLGAEVIEYVQDFYGDTASELHNGLGTDRFVVAWKIAEVGTMAAQKTADPASFAGAPVVNAAPAEDGSPPTARLTPEHSPLVRIQLPLDIHEVQAVSSPRAGQWRASTRQAFLDWFARGYRVVGFYRDDAAARCYYVLGEGEA